jgi:hypothetical protein
MPIEKSKIKGLCDGFVAQHPNTKGNFGHSITVQHWERLHLRELIILRLDGVEKEQAATEFIASHLQPFCNSATHSAKINLYRQAKSVYALPLLL